MWEQRKAEDSNLTRRTVRIAFQAISAPRRITFRRFVRTAGIEPAISSPPDSMLVGTSGPPHRCATSLPQGESASPTRAAHDFMSALSRSGRQESNLRSRVPQTRAFAWLSYALIGDLVFLCVARRHMNFVRSTSLAEADSRRGRLGARHECRGDRRSPLRRGPVFCHGPGRGSAHRVGDVRAALTPRGTSAEPGHRSTVARARAGHPRRGGSAARRGGLPASAAYGAASFRPPRACDSPCDRCRRNRR